MAAQLQTPPASPRDDRSTTPPRPGRRAVRAVLWVVCALTFVVGGVFTGAGLVQGSGFFSTGYESLKTDSAAMVTREIDVEGRVPTDPQDDPGDLARVRIQVKHADPQKPVFIGIAKRSDVERYLSGVKHDEMSTFELDPLRVTWQRHSGTDKASPPAEQSIWAATSKVTGPGTAELQWDKSLGEWMAVAMNADGTPGVDIEANVGLRFGFLLPVGVGLLLLSLLVSGSLLLARVRTSSATARATHVSATSSSANSRMG